MEYRNKTDAAEKTNQVLYVQYSTHGFCMVKQNLSAACLATLEGTRLISVLDLEGWLYLLEYPGT